MPTLRHRLLGLSAILLIALAAQTASAQEPIRFARTPDVSPDGRLVAFSYLGDIWIVEAIGGVARPVTLHEAHEIDPVFSPDGRWIAFSSNRHGSYDVFVSPVAGGRPKRLTFDSAPDMVCGWSPDGKEVLYATIRAGFPPAYELYAVSAAGGPERRIGLADSKEGAFSPKGDQLAFVRGPGLWYRKGYRGSTNDDVWIAHADGSGVRRLTDFNGQDGSPMWSADGQTIFYVSEQFGTPANIVARPAAGGSPRQITFHTDDTVRKARISANGEWIVYECGADLWMVSAHGGSPRKLAIEVHADDKSNAERIVTYKDKIAEFCPSPDEKHVVFVVHGNLFLMPLPGGGQATRLTEGAFFDHDPVWAPDGKSVLFVSDRGGRDDIYRLESDDPEHKELTAAHRFKLHRITDTPEAESGLAFSPNGSRLAFLLGGQLWTMKPNGTDAKVAVAERRVTDFDWSPDSKWLVWSRTDGSFASEVYASPLDGSAPPRNLTRYATYNADVTWSHTGGKIAFISQRRGSPLMYLLPLQKPASESSSSASSAPADIDWDDIHLRAIPASPVPAVEGAISRDGSNVAFRNGGDLWVAGPGGSQLARVATGIVPNRGEHGFGPQIRWSRRSSSRLYFLDKQGVIRVGRASGGDPQKVNFTARMTVGRTEEFRATFDQAWRILADGFYDPNYRGADWKLVRRKYEPLVAHIAQREDLYALISLMLGELNSSHLGIHGPSSVSLPPEETTAELGLLFDESYSGPGLRVAEILKHGPADRRGLKLREGDIILAIDRTPIASQTNLAQLLNGKVKEAVLLTVASSPKADPRDPKGRRQVEVTAVDRDSMNKLLYQRWVARNAERVRILSHGALGYIHIPSMNEAGLETFVRALYSDDFNKDAILIDVRYNGGGFTHDQILKYLGAREHTLFRQRDGGEGQVLRASDRKWYKPVVVLINNRSFSDAEIFPSAFRALGLGKLVGQSTGGYVIGTTETRLIDGSAFRVPTVGVFTANGVNMDREGVSPDVPVDADPDALAKGQDAQLAKAVEVLQKEVVAWKAARGARAQAPPAKGATNGR